MILMPDEIFIEVYPERPQGGQHVTVTSSGVKVTHIPTGTIAISQMARSQHKNREIAFDMIVAALTHP